MICTEGDKRDSVGIREGMGRRREYKRILRLDYGGSLGKAS
jgi:hypothetical protein